MYNVRRLDTTFDAYGVDLAMVVIWGIGEQNLHEVDVGKSVEFNIKIDGRPLGGKLAANPLGIIHSINCLFPLFSTSDIVRDSQLLFQGPNGILIP